MVLLEQILASVWVDVSTVAGALFYAFLFWLAASLLARLIRKAADDLIQGDSHKHLDPTIVIFLAELARLAIFIAALVLYAHLIPALRSLGTALLASVSIVSIIAGIAAQGTFGNLIAGIALLLYRPFRVGDTISIFVLGGTEQGVVERITLGYTFLVAEDQRRVVVPNSLLSAQAMLNLTARLPKPAVAQVTVRVDAEQSAAARELLLSLAQQHPRTQEPISCHIMGLDRAGAVIQVAATCSDPHDLQHVASDLYLGFPERLSRAGVALAASPTTGDELLHNVEDLSHK